LHVGPGQQAVLVGPAREDQKNVLRPGIFPFACWKVDHMRFAFDSSLPQPDMKIELAQLGSLITAHSQPRFPGQPSRLPLLSVFGHADPTGQDDYNKILAGRRARSIYALLTRKPEMWEQLYSNHEGTSDGWAPSSIKAIHEFLERPGDPPTESSGRKALFLAYMDFLCTPDGGTPLKVDPASFLGHGSDAKGKADYQGCGEFNPLLLLGQHDEDTLPQQERNERYQVDRRVVVLLFRSEGRCDQVAMPPDERGRRRLQEAIF
jgi:hypothetical protein